MFEIEMFVSIKMDLAITYNGWHAIKPSQSKTNNLHCYSVSSVPFKYK